MDDEVKDMQEKVAELIKKGKRPNSYSSWGYLKPIRRQTKTTGTQYLRRRWKCKCQCGNEVVIPEYYMKRLPNPKIHCGCLAGSDKTREKPTYNSWYMMHERCLNEDHKDHHHYGGRGITICDRWNKFVVGVDQAFANFLADMGPRPEDRTLDRIDNDGNYEPSNCRWATATEQRANQRGM